MKPLFKEDLEQILAQSHEDLLSLKGGHLFVTGGTGFFGKWILESLSYANQRLLGGTLKITALARDPARAKSLYAETRAANSVEWISGDIATFSFPEGSFSHVIHAATPARASVNELAPLTMLETTVQGTLRTLEFARKAGVSRFLLTSSGAVYGQQPSDLYGVPESHPGSLNPMDSKNAYAIGKLLSEHFCRHYSNSQLKCLIARCFAFVGPGLPLDEHFAIGNFIGDALAGKKITIKGDGTPFRSYLYPTDLMVHLLAILARGESCTPYNVGSAQAIDIRGTAEAVSRVAGGSYEVLGTPDPSRAPTRYVPDTSKIVRELIPQLPLPLDQAILRTLQWHKGDLKS